MPKINTEILEVQWDKSQSTINELLIKNDKPTIKMMQFYKLYISSPFDITAKSLFEYSFYNWYKENNKLEEKNYV